MKTMLLGLDDINWEELEHANGPATDVPDDLEALASIDPDERLRAFDDLENNINHQGGATPAAVAVVPFLIQLVAAPEVEDKARLLRLLTDLSAGGSHEQCLSEGVSPLPDDSTDELAELAELHRRVADGWESYAARLDEREAAERSAALMLLAFLPRHAARSAPLVRARLAVETDIEVRATALLTLGLLGQQLGSSDDVPRLRAALEAEDSAALVRLVGAIALTYIAPGDVPRSAVDALSHAVDAPPPVGDAFPWNRGDLRGYAAVVLTTLARVRGDATVLSALLDRTEGRTLVQAAEALLEVVFAGEPPWSGPPRPASSLNEAQRSALQRIARKNLSLDLGYALKRHGIFPFGPELSRWLGLSAQGILDKEIDGAPLWLHCRRVLDGQEDRGAWIAVIERSLTPAQVVELCADAGSGAYRLFQEWPPRPLPEHKMFPDNAKLAELLTSTLVACSDTAHVTGYADELVGARRAPRECAAASSALSTLLQREGRILDEKYDPVVRVGMFSAFQRLMREVLATLPIERQKQLILPLKLIHYIEGDDYVMLQGWHYIDLCPCLEAAEKVIEAVLGSTRFPPPRERAVATLAGVGRAITPRLEELLRDGATPHRGIFEEARRRIEDGAA